MHTIGNLYIKAQYVVLQNFPNLLSVRKNYNPIVP